jgi:hypothetical protein
MISGMFMKFNENRNGTWIIGITNLILKIEWIQVSKSSGVIILNILVSEGVSRCIK